MGDKPKFNPNQSYEAVDVAEKPAFNPDAPYEEVKKKELTEPTQPFIAPLTNGGQEPKASPYAPNTPLQSDSADGTSEPTPSTSDFSLKNNSSLNSEEQKNFDNLVKKYPRLVPDKKDYDVQGWYLKNKDKAEEILSEKNKNPDLHYGTDEFKKPNHPTFSSESIYSGTEGYEGGKWNKDYTEYTPSKTNLQFHNDLPDYFSKAEKGVKLNLANQQSDLLSKKIKADSQQLVEAKRQQLFDTHPLFTTSPNAEKNKQIFDKQIGHYESPLENQWSVLQPIADWSNKFVEQTGENIAEGGKKIGEGALEYSLGSQVGDPSMVVHGGIKATTGATQVAFNVIPAAIEFNAATSAIKEIADKNLSKENADKVGYAMDAPFSMGTKLASVFGRNPEEGSTEAMAYELANFFFAAGAFKAGGWAKENIKSGKDLQELSKKIADKKATPEQETEFNKFVEVLPTITVADIKATAEQQPNNPHSEQVIAKINDLEKSAEPKSNPELDKLQQEHKDWLESDVPPEMKAQKVEESAQAIQNHLNSHLEEGVKKAEQSNELDNIDNGINTIEADKLKLQNNNPTVLGELDKHLEDLQNKKQRLQNEPTNENAPQTEGKPNGERVSGDVANDKTMADGSEQNAEGQIQTPTAEAVNGENTPQLQIQFPEQLEINKHIEDGTITKQQADSFAESEPSTETIENLESKEEGSSEIGQLESVIAEADNLIPKPPIEQEGQQESLGGDLHSAKNEAVEAKRKEIGLHPIMQEIKTSAPKLMEEASAIVAEDKVQGMVDTAIRDKRYTFTAAEQIAISYSRDVINDKYIDLDNQLTEARTKTDLDKIADLESQRLSQEYLLNDYDQVLRNTGTTSGQVLWARRLFVNRQFDKAIIISKMKANAKDGVVPKEITDQVEKLTKERDDLTKQLETAEKSHKAEQDKLRTELEKAQVEHHQKEKKDRKPVSATERNKVWADNVRKLKSKPFLFVDENGVSHDVTANGATWNNLIEQTAKAIETAGKIEDKIRDIIKQHPLYDKLSDKDRERLAKQLQDEAESQGKPQTFESLAEKIGAESGGELHEGLLSDIDKMFRKKVEEGATDYNKITEDIHKELLPHIPNLDVTELRDLISGYGKFKELSKDETVRAIAEMKNQMRLDAKVEATERGELPLRNGLERAKQSQATREKNAKILKNIKEKGIEPTLTEAEQASAYKTATDAHHTRLENAIADIEKEIADNKKREKAGKKVYSDKRSKELESDLAVMKGLKSLHFKEQPKSALEKLVLKAKELTDKIGEAKKEGRTKDVEQLEKEKALTEGEIPNLLKSLEQPKSAEQIKSDNAINSAQKAIDKLNKQIDNLKDGKTVDGAPITIKSKEGNKTFGFGKEKTAPIDNARLRELQNLKAGLEQEVSDLMPDAVKDQAILAKIKTNRQRRLDFLNDKLEKSKTDKTVFDKKIREPYKVTSTDGKTIDAQKVIEETNLKIKKAEKELAQIQEDWRLANRSGLEKVGDLLNAIAREGAISNPLAIPKIFSSGVLTQIARPLENLIGVPSTMMLPKSVRENVTMEGKFSASIEGKAYKEFFNSQNWKEAWTKLKTGEHREDTLYGEHKFQDHYIKIKNPINGKTYNINPAISGRMHAFSKTVPYKVGYERNRMYAYQDAILKHPEYFDKDGTMTRQAQAMIEAQAYEHALGDAMLQKHWISKGVRGWIAELERKDTALPKVGAFALNNIFKVLNVSANYFSAGLNYTPILGHLTAALSLPKRGVEMTSERANQIARINKRANVGMLLFTIGAVNPEIFGGYGKYDEKNKKGVKSGNVNIGGKELPHWLTHTPFLVPFQLGATMGNYFREEHKKDTGATVLRNAITGVVETNPFAYTFQTFTSALETDKKMSQFIFDEAFGQWIPYSAAVRKIGEWNDTDKKGKTQKRKPSNEIIQGFEDRMKIATGIDRHSVKKAKK